MKHAIVRTTWLGVALAAPALLSAQSAPAPPPSPVFAVSASAEAPPPPPLVEQPARRQGGVVRPILRTLATMAASTAGYAIADARTDPGTADVRYAPIAAGAAASAITGILLSSGNPAKILVGSALSTLPAAALSTYLDGVLAEDRGDYPLVAFGLPHGLLTSAFAQDR